MRGDWICAGGVDVVVLDSTTSRVCLDAHPVALSYLLIQYADDWESALQFIVAVAALQGINLDEDATRHLVSEFYKEK